MIVAIRVMYTIMMIMHVSVAELLVFEIQSKHWNQLGNWTLHAHQTTEPFKRSFTDSWCESCYSRQFRAVITPIDVVYKFLKDFFLGGKGEEI